MKRVITIDEFQVDSRIWGNDDWKGYVTENFDEKIVLVGNPRGIVNIELASWWKEAQAVIAEIDSCGIGCSCAEEQAFKDYFADKYSEGKIKAIIDLCNRSGDSESSNYDASEFIIGLISILHPELDVKYTTIKGYTQGDWKDCYYVDDGVDEDLLSDWVFGNVAEIHYETEDGDDNGYTYVTHTELSKYSGNDLKAYLANLIGVVNDDTLIVRRVSGYTSTPVYEDL